MQRIRAFNDMLTPQKRCYHTQTQSSCMIKEQINVCNEQHISDFQKIIFEYTEYHYCRIVIEAIFALLHVLF